MKLYSHAERPDLLERRDELGATWDEFMYHDAVASVYWDRQYEEYPDLQLWLVDDDDRLLAESNAVADSVRPGRAARRWLGRGARAGVRRPAREGRLRDRDHDRCRAARQGPSKTMLDGMRKAVAARGLSDLVAPVRPSLKHVYPLTPIERYVEWRRDDGKLLDRLAPRARAGGREADQRRRRARCGSQARSADWERLDEARLPRQRYLCRPGRARPGRDRPRARRGRLRRAQRLDAPPI